MNGFHPNVMRAATCALAAAVLAAGGCKSTSSGVNNPFLAPDRVAPPSTRALAPGQAQPYYQGDPLPVMQSATAPSTNAVAASGSDASTLSSSGRTLAWNAPGNSPTVAASAAAPVVGGTGSPWDPAPKAAAPIAYANEQPVSVPTDTGELRFALPSPTAPGLAAPVAGSTPPASQPNSGSAPLPPVQNQSVVLASYDAPAAGGLTPVATQPALVPTPQPTSPWRTPQVAQQVSPPAAAPMYGMQASPNQAAMVQPVAPPTATNTVAVQLRSVPAPPPQPGDPMPRIRFPGYDVPQTAVADNFRPRTAMR